MFVVLITLIVFVLFLRHVEVSRCVVFNEHRRFSTEMGFLLFSSVWTSFGQRQAVDQLLLSNLFLDYFIVFLFYDQLRFLISDRSFQHARCCQLG